MINAFKAWPPSARVGFVFLFALVFWSPSLFGDFAWDDTNNLVDSDRLRNWAAFGESFRHDAMWSARMNVAAIATYRPISLASFVVDYQLFGGSALAYHFTSIFWHALATVVVFLVLRRFIDVVAAALLTCLWCMVPANAEAVAWINGRSEIFALLFGGLGVYIATAPRLHGLLRMLGAAPFLLLAMLGKESGVVFCAAAVLLGTEMRHRLAQRTGWWLRSLDAPAVFAGLAALGGYLWIRHLVFDGHPLPGAAEKLSSSTDLMAILGQAASIVWKCFTSVAVPVRISVGYLYLWAKALTTTDLIIAWVSLAAVLVGLVIAWFRGHRLPVLLLAWWAISIVPVLVLVGRDWPGLARWLYMGGPGLVAGVGLLVAALPFPRVAPTVAMLYGLVWAVQAQRSIDVWFDSGTLFEKMVEEEPLERFGFLSLSWYYLRLGDYPASEKNARKVLELGPRGHDPLPFLAASIAGQNRCEEARKTIFEPQPVATRPAWMVYAIGLCFERAKQYADAMAMYQDCSNGGDKACTSAVTIASNALASATPSAPPSDGPPGTSAPPSDAPPGTSAQPGTVRGLDLNDAWE